MRDGLEIDTSDVLCSVPVGTVVHVIEQRMNSSNVWRLKVGYYSILLHPFLPHVIILHLQHHTLSYYILSYHILSYYMLFYYSI